MILGHDDLNRLDRYIREKNRLHNRYLLGSGVVAGLEVVCNACEGSVTVRSGYALSPCGEDIVVPCDEDVKVCDLINKCRVPDAECDPTVPHRHEDCDDDVEQEWLLKICYDERPARGVKALRSSGRDCGRCRCREEEPKRDCGCGCHGSAVSADPGCSSCRCDTGGRTQGACGCGCHGQMSRRKPWIAISPSQCEPSMVCESYHFEMCRAPIPKRGPAVVGREIGGAGTVSEDFGRYWAAINKAMPTVPTNKTPSNMYKWGQRARGAVVGLLGDHGDHDCRIYDKLRRIGVPEPDETVTDVAYARSVERAVADYALVGAQSAAARLCSLLLPPLSDPTEDCVVLATITVRRSDCSIIRICNLENRDIAITWPTVRYWLSALGIEQVVRRALAELCCPDEPDRSKPVRFDAAIVEASMATADEPRVATVIELAAQPERRVDSYAMLLDALGAVRPDNAPLVSPSERALPLEAMLLGKVVAPLTDALGPTSTGASGGAGPKARAAIGGQDADLTDLKTTINQLRSQLQTQARQIKQLRERK
jgi:hypothetical protein